MDQNQREVDIDRRAIAHELDRIARAADVMKKDRKTERLVPDHGALGKAIGRSHNALTTVLKGGDIDTRTLRLLLAYAQRHVPGYSPVPLLRALRLLPDDSGLPDNEADQLAILLQEELDISDEALEEMYRFVQTAKRMRRTVVERAPTLRIAPPAEPSQTGAPDAQ